MSVMYTILRIFTLEEKGVSDQIRVLLKFAESNKLETIVIFHDSRTQNPHRHTDGRTDEHGIRKPP